MVFVLQKGIRGCPRC